LGRLRQALNLWSMQPEYTTGFSISYIYSNFGCKVSSSFLSRL